MLDIVLVRRLLIKVLAVSYWCSVVNVGVRLGKGVMIKVGMLWLVKKSKSSVRACMTMSAIPDVIVCPG